MSTTTTTTTDRDEAVIDPTVLVRTDERPDPPSPAQASLTFAWRAVLRIRHVPEQLLDVTLFPVMFLVMFTYLFGGAVAGSTGAYLADVLPGVLVMQIVWISMYTGHTVNRDILTGVHDRFRSLPVWRPAPLVGPLLADLVRYAAASVVLLSVGWLMGFRPRGDAVGMLAGVALVLVFAFGLSWIWTLVGIVLRSENAVMTVGNTIMFPITFVSNVFVPVETLPGWLQPVVAVNPISVLTSAVRGWVHGTPDLGASVLVLVASAVLTLVFGPWTMRRYHRHTG